MCCEPEIADGCIPWTGEMREGELVDGAEDDVEDDEGESE